jgi:hypothetical protein
MTMQQEYAVKRLLVIEMPGHKKSDYTLLAEFTCPAFDIPQKRDRLQEDLEYHNSKTFRVHTTDTLRAAFPEMADKLVTSATEIANGDVAFDDVLSHFKGSDNQLTM